MQTSKKLSTVAEDRLLEQFYNVLAEFSHPAEVEKFLFSFLSPTERLVFAKRLEIAWLLHQGHSYDEIAKTLNVSSATISSVADTKDSYGMQQAFKLIKLDHQATTALKKLQFWKR